MIKSESYYIEQLKIFYSYLYYLKYIYNLLSYNDTTFNNLKEFLNLIDEYQKQLDKEYLDEIGIRVNYYIEQSVLTHQKDFFIYFSQNYFFSTEEDKKEEIEQILQTKNKYIEINTFITNHSSIYNNNTDETDTDGGILYMNYNSTAKVVNSTISNNKGSSLIMNGNCSLSLNNKAF